MADRRSSDSIPMKEAPAVREGDGEDGSEDRQLVDWTANALPGEPNGTRASAVVRQRHAP